MKLDEKSQIIYDVIPVGADQRISAKEISDWTGFDPRSIRHSISKMRLNLIPIGSDNAGYFRVGSADDLPAFMESSQTISVHGLQELAIAEAMHSAVAIFMTNKEAKTNE